MEPNWGKRQNFNHHRILLLLRRSLNHHRITSAHSTDHKKQNVTQILQVIYICLPSTLACVTLTGMMRWVKQQIRYFILFNSPLTFSGLHWQLILSHYQNLKQVLITIFYLSFVPSRLPELRHGTQPFTSITYTVDHFVLSLNPSPSSKSL